MATHSRYLGAKVINIPLLEENKFLPDLSAINPDDAVKANCFILIILTTQPEQLLQMSFLMKSLNLLSNIIF